MKKFIVVAVLVALVAGIASFTHNPTPGTIDVNDSLRALYSRPVAEWPKPTIEAGVQWKEMSALPVDSNIVANLKDPKINLGKLLFFDPRLSGSNQISCSSCHDPDLAWTDGRTVSLGSDRRQGTRNTSTLLNVAQVKDLFWDGRSTSLEDQAINPIATIHEMNQEPPTIPEELEAIPGYVDLFEKVYGSKRISLDRVLDALAAFERSIASRSSRFDEFINGKYTKLNDEEIQGLHLFRTKARCMNCHNGTYFTDNQFHNIGLTYYGRKYEDLGRYKVTKEAADVGKFRTPSLRDVMKTRPWMHNGLFYNIEGIMNMYSAGMPQPKRKPEQANDPLFPATDLLIKKLDLTPEEKKSLIAFLDAITGVPDKMDRPELPK
ncbi:cytochrome c peroxidase [Paraflavitalea sp. CAU 1676]|uniref:cytochrome-c peroxidase n=1 Tax=Paraflavitalea sp. CAU 1676 TaxID=3032598 RepID=UPI0023DC5FB9|nr:cytochrome c peroxidase [Paraflavitalea sp. CAU 1676]MDF2191937.1 cytochrome c peroxidase [Paraflavitalea sp. CAU 1676]